MRCEPVCSDSLCLTGALFNARSGHVKEQSLILCHCDNQLQSLLNAENSVAIAAAIAKDMDGKRHGNARDAAFGGTSSDS